MGKEESTVGRIREKIRCKTKVTERGSYDRHAVRLSVLPVALRHLV